MKGRAVMAEREYTEVVEIPVLEGVDPGAQEVLLGFIATVVNKMPEEMGLKLFDDLKQIAVACYRCKWDERPSRLH
jgi:hypothetical protein